MQEHPVSEGECAECGRWMKLPSRGICERCSYVLPPGSGVDRRKQAVNAEDADREKRFHRVFVDVVAPRVTKYAHFRLKNLLPGAEREEFVAEAVAISWKRPARETKDWP